MYEHEKLPLGVHIALGVAAGIVIAAAVIWQFSEWRMRVALEDIQVKLRAAEAATQQQAVAQAARVEAERLAEQRRIAEGQRVAEQLKRQALDRAEAKEQAWKRFYQKPVRCDDSRGGTWSTECANEFIRAKRDFELRYAEGRL